MTTPPPLLADQDSPRDAIVALSAIFAGWVASGPNEQPHYPGGMRPFSTGDLKYYAKRLSQTATALEALSADLCAKIAQNSELAAERDALKADVAEVEAEMGEAYRYWIESGCDPSEAITALFDWGLRLHKALNGAPQP